LKAITVKEVAKYLKTKPCTIYKLCKEKKIPHIKLTSHIRFHKDIIDEWIKTITKMNVEIFPEKKLKCGNCSSVKKVKMYIIGDDLENPVPRCLECITELQYKFFQKLSEFKEKI